MTMLGRLRNLVYNKGRAPHKLINETSAKMELSNTDNNI